MGLVKNIQAVATGMGLKLIAVCITHTNTPTPITKSSNNILLSHVRNVWFNPTNSKSTSTYPKVSHASHVIDFNFWESLELHVKDSHSFSFSNFKSHQKKKRGQSIGVCGTSTRTKN